MSDSWEFFLDIIGLNQDIREQANLNVGVSPAFREKQR